MSRWKRNLVWGIAFLFILSICGCQSDDSSDLNQQLYEAQELTSDHKDDTLDKKESVISSTGTKELENEDIDGVKEISIYTLDSETAEKVPVTALIPKDTKITPQLIVDKVTESMTDAACMVGVDSVTTDGDRVIISFKEDQPPVMNVGSSVEAGILDSFAQSILDNVLEYHKVVFRIMDQPYVTGHFEFGIDEVYMETSNDTSKEKSSVSSAASVQVKEDLDEMQELSIYTLDAETAEKVPLTALVPKNTVLTPQLIVDKVTESMMDAACMVGVDSVTIDGDRVIISFKENQPPVTNVGSSVEAGILDSFAQSILDNLKEYHKVIFRIMDQPYATGHFEFGIDEVYMESSSK